MWRSKDFFKLLLALALAGGIAAGIVPEWRAVPVRSLDIMLAFFPADDLFALEADPQAACGHLAARKWLRYFRHVVAFKPGLADAHGMLGFCYAHLRQERKAILAYQEAARINPHFWGFHYNLGVLFLRQNNSAQAHQHFAKALATDPKLNLMFIYSSKMFTDLARKSRQKDLDLTQRLQLGYRLSQAASLAGGADLPLRMF